MCKRYLLTAITVLLAAILMAACGTSSPMPTTTDTPSQPLELLQRSVARAAEMESVRADVYLAMSVMGQTMTVTAETEMAKNGDTRMAMVVDVPEETVEMEMELITSLPDIYVKLPDEGWFIANIEDLGDLEALPLDAFDINPFASLFPAEDVLWDLYTVESLGREELDGVETEHLGVWMDFQGVWESLNDDQREQLVGFIGTEGTELVEGFIENIAVTQFEVWIDDEANNRRTLLTVVITEPFTGMEMSMETNMRAFDFDEEITIELPQDYQPLPEGGF